MSRLERGISLVELMVGIAVGLLVLAAATTVVTGQLGSTRQLLMETQLDQDMRAAAEIVSRELRRSAAVAETPRSLWANADQLSVDQDTETATQISGTDNSQALIWYRRGPGEDRTGFKLENDTIKIMLDNGSWQELTDPLSVKVTRFSIGTARDGDRARSDNNQPRILACPFQCPGGGTACWPRLNPTEFTITIEAEMKRDSSIRRSLTTSVAARSQRITFTADSSAPVNMQSCPVLPG